MLVGCQKFCWLDVDVAGPKVCKLDKSQKISQRIFKKSCAFEMIPTNGSLLSSLP